MSFANSFINDMERPRNYIVNHVRAREKLENCYVQHLRKNVTASMKIMQISLKQSMILTTVSVMELYMAVDMISIIRK